MSSWLERAVADVLQKVLGAFVKGIDKDSLKLSVWKGDVRLTGLELRTEVLDELAIPVRVLGASLGEVRLVVPWRNLFGKDPLIITLDQLLVLVAPLPDGSDEKEAAGTTELMTEIAAKDATAKSDLAEAKGSVDAQKSVGKQVSPLPIVA